jgi:hypothetical protein
MQMNSAPHLLSEDRAEFGRILDEALRNAHERPDLATVGHRLTADQLRAMALDATSLIAGAAAAEYEHYRDVRDELRAPRPLSVLDAMPASRRPRTSSVLGDPARTGAGILAVIAVLVPVLATIAAVIFLIFGYVLTALGSTHAIAGTLVAVGWFFAAVMAVGIMAGGVGLVITALRNGSSQIRSAGGMEPAELTDAREAWRLSLLENGIVPFLRDALANGGGEVPPPRTPPGPSTPLRPGPSNGTGDHGVSSHARQFPKMGYSRPDFSSPGEGATTSRRPTYSSPDFSSPEYGGPEHQPE